MQSEIIFIIEESPEGGYEARALGNSIFTEGDTFDEIKKNIVEAVNCHFVFPGPHALKKNNFQIGLYF